MIPRRRTKDIGDAVERRAEQYLLDQGLRVIERNFRCKTGEIDLIMRDHNSIVFVEVRFRQSQRYGDAAASVTPTKQKRLIHTALYYLQTRGKHDTPCRFDVLAACGGEKNTVQFDWIQNAFDTD